MVPIVSRLGRISRSNSVMARGEPANCWFSIARSHATHAFHYRVTTRPAFCLPPRALQIPTLNSIRRPGGHSMRRRICDKLKNYIYITDEAPCEDSLKHYQNAKYKQMLLRHPKLPDKDHCRRSSTVWFLKTKMLYISKDSSSRLLKIGDSVRTIFQYSTNLLILTRTFYIVNKKFKWIRLLDIFLVRQRIITRHIRGRRAILLS